jgi:hypothetical protein
MLRRSMPLYRCRCHPDGFQANVAAALAANTIALAATIASRTFVFTLLATQHVA